MIMSPTRKQQTTSQLASSGGKGQNKDTQIGINILILKYKIESR